MQKWKDHTVLILQFDPAEMFKNTFQSGFLSILYSLGYVYSVSSELLVVKLNVFYIPTYNFCLLVESPISNMFSLG